MDNYITEICKNTSLINQYKVLNSLPKHILLETIPREKIKFWDFILKFHNLKPQDSFWSKDIFSKYFYDATKTISTKVCDSHDCETWNKKDSKCTLNHVLTYLGTLNDYDDIDEKITALVFSYNQQELKCIDVIIDFKDNTKPTMNIRLRDIINLYDSGKINCTSHLFHHPGQRHPAVISIGEILKELEEKFSNITLSDEPQILYIVPWYDLEPQKYQFVDGNIDDCKSKVIYKTKREDNYILEGKIWGREWNPIRNPIRNPINIANKFDQVLKLTDKLNVSIKSISSTIDQYWSNKTQFIIEDDIKSLHIPTKCKYYS